MCWCLRAARLDNPGRQDQKQTKLHHKEFVVPAGGYVGLDVCVFLQERMSPF